MKQFEKIGRRLDSNKVDAIARMGAADATAEPLEANGSSLTLGKGISACDRR